MHAHIHMYTYTNIYIHTHLYIYARTHTHTHTHTHTYTFCLFGFTKYYSNNKITNSHKKIVTCAISFVNFAIIRYDRIILFIKEQPQLQTKQELFLISVKKKKKNLKKSGKPQGFHTMKHKLSEFISSPAKKKKKKICYAPLNLSCAVLDLLCISTNYYAY